MSMRVPNEYRIREGSMGSDDSIGNNGAFIVPRASQRNQLNVIASDGGGWEHVSVSKAYETPTWGEMCFIKGLFWEAEDCVIQFHPPRSSYVNNHPYCLHMWRPTQAEFPKPPEWMIGDKSLGRIIP